MIKDHPALPDKLELAIRFANRTDAALLARFAQALAAEEGRHSRAAPEALEAAIDAGRARFLLAFHLEIPLGMLMFYAGYDLESAAPGAHLGDVYVIPQARRRGVAVGLMQAMAQAVRKENGEWVSLTVLEGNDAAQGLYAQLGMVSMPVRFMAIGPQGLNKLRSAQHAI